MTTKTVPAEVGILYSARMILAYVNKQKTQTRRTAGLNEINKEPDRWQLEELAKMDGAMWAHFRRDDGIFRAIKCRYGVPGETVLWTRETWQLLRFFTDWETGHVEDWDSWDDKIPPEKPEFWNIVFRADGYFEEERNDRGFGWRPGIHQPRWAARTTKPLTGLRCERMNSISAADACAEGAAEILLGPLADLLREAAFRRGTWCEQLQDWHAGVVEAYAALWDSLNGDGDFEKNKWVWVLEYPKYEDSK